MATLTISLPDAMKEWIESRIACGEFSTSSDYVRDAIRRDRERVEHDERLEALRQYVKEAKASGISKRTVSEIMAEAKEVARSHGLLRE